MRSLDSFSCRETLTIGSNEYTYYSLKTAEENGVVGLGTLPYSLKVLVENMLRNEDGKAVTATSVRHLAESVNGPKSDIAFYPARVLLQDFTGVPAVADLAAMRDAAAEFNMDASRVNPLIPVDLVIDHSVSVDYFGARSAFRSNIAREYERNGERYRFLRWGQQAFDNFRVVPPGTGICHQVNLEYLAQVVRTVAGEGGEQVLIPDTLVGADSHTTMVNALAVLGWGVGGIEAEAAMLGQAVSMLMPEVVGFRLENTLPEGTTATDLVLRVVEILRNEGVVGKFVEFYGPGLNDLTLEDRSTIANMAPEYGATCGFFPIDNDTLAYLRATNRSEEHIAVVEAYAKAQGMFRSEGAPDPVFASSVSLDLGTVTPSVAGPKRPQDRISLERTVSVVSDLIEDSVEDSETRVQVANADTEIGHGDIVIAAITSCTNTSNPAVLIAAGLVAKNAVERGLTTKPWVKTSLAPGSKVVTDYLAEAGLDQPLNALGFDLVGYGCTTCIGNSGPLSPEISEAVRGHDLLVCSVLSGNRNFEGRINPDVKANFIASPPLVVAYAIAGTMLCDLASDPLGFDAAGEPVYLRDLWPSSAEIAEVVRTSVRKEHYAARYGAVFEGDEQWQAVKVDDSALYPWESSSTYIQRPPYFDSVQPSASAATPISNAKILALFGDSITTDHISPAGSFTEKQPAGAYLAERQVRPQDFNSYGSRRGNHEVMMRGTFANVRIRNHMAPDTEGGFTKHQPSGDVVSIFEAAARYREEGTPLIVMAGREYGTGSSRDWAAKGSALLGVKAVIAQSFERIHRSNLIGMGVLPLTFQEGTSWQSLEITGTETITIDELDAISPRCNLTAVVQRADGTQTEVPLLCRIDTEDELTYYTNGGILHYMLRRMSAATA